MTKAAEVYAGQLVRALEGDSVAIVEDGTVSVAVGDITITLDMGDYQKLIDAFTSRIAAAYEDGCDDGYNAGVEKGYRNCYEEGAQLYE